MSIILCALTKDYAHIATSVSFKTFKAHRHRYYDPTSKQWLGNPQDDFTVSSSTKNPSDNDGPQSFYLGRTVLTLILMALIAITSMIPLVSCNAAVCFKY